MMSSQLFFRANIKKCCYNGITKDADSDKESIWFVTIGAMRATVNNAS